MPVPVDHIFDLFFFSFADHEMVLYGVAQYTCCSARIQIWNNLYSSVPLAHQLNTKPTSYSDYAAAGAAVAAVVVIIAAGAAAILLLLLLLKLKIYNVNVANNSDCNFILICCLSVCVRVN